MQAEAFYDGKPGDLLYDVTNELVDLAREKKILTKGTMLEKYRNQINNYQFRTLTEDEKIDIYNKLDELMMEFTKDSSELTYRNKTPEEVVLIYITSGLFCD